MNANLTFFPRLGTLLALVFATAGLQAQIAFTNSNSLLPNGNAHSGVAIAVTDMNGDGLDDIAHLDNAKILHIVYQNANGTFTDYAFGNVSSANQWSMCVADVDNNGFNDVFSGGAYDGLRIITAAADGDTYSYVPVMGPNTFVQGSNFADINNDGYVDLFACHDDGESRIWANNGDGTFTSADGWINMATVPASDNSGNYGSIWTDFDNDGDIDLYIAKCRQGVSNPTDPRRINALFVNDGAGNFSEQAQEYGLKIGAQSWTADFNDIDNDGDMDCFITNHDVASMLLENDGTGHFTDITATAGLAIGGLPIQGVMRDFDNDGFVDVLVAGTNHYLFRNNGDKTFSAVPNPFDNNDMESYAIGDLNHDGFLDIYGGYANIYTSPSNIADVLWLNQGNDNHFLAVQLIGEVSNRNGIGARVEIYGDWGIQIREVRSGESYGIMNSMIQHFGMGASEVVDSLIVRWPSGIIDTYLNIDADQQLTLIEDNCVSPPATVMALGETTFCSGESVELSAPEGFNYLWSNGEMTQNIVVADAGSYSVTVSDGSGCYGVSTAVDIVVDPVLEPAVQPLGDLTFCEGGEVTLTTAEADGYLWSTGATTQSILVSEAGSYSVTVQGLCDEYTSAEVSVETWTVELPEVENDTLEEAGTAMLTATGNDPHWYDAFFGGNLLGTGNSFTTPVLDMSTTYYVEDLDIFGQASYTGGQAEHTGTSEYGGNQFNGQIIFDCHEPFVLKTVKVYTDTPGDRVIEILDENENVLESVQVNIPAGESTIVVDLPVTPGNNLRLTTNTDFNNSEFGFNSPRLQRSSQDVQYPYLIGDVATLKESQFGADWYYYFYNWTVEIPGSECVSERVPVEVVFQIPDAVQEELLLRGVSLYPNPSKGLVQLTLSQPLTEEGQLLLRDLTGKQLLLDRLGAGATQYDLNMGNLPAGLYLVQLSSGGRVFNAKVVRE